MKRGKLNWIFSIFFSSSIFRGKKKYFLFSYLHHPLLLLFLLLFSPSSACVYITDCLAYLHMIAFRLIASCLTKWIRSWKKKNDNAENIVFLSLYLSLIIATSYHHLQPDLYRAHSAYTSKSASSHLQNKTYPQLDSTRLNIYFFLFLSVASELKCWCLPNIDDDKRQTTMTTMTMNVWLHIEEDIITRVITNTYYEMRIIGSERAANIF